MKASFRKIIAAVTLTLALQSLSTAQEVTRSAQIPGLRPYKIDLECMSKAEKDSVRMVAELWKGYVESFTSSSVDEARRRAYWVDGSPDYLQEFDDGNLLYASFRENRILDVRKVGDGIYELTVATFSKLPGEEYSDWVETVFRVRAEAVASGQGGKANPFRLRNFLDAEMPAVTKSRFKGIEYHCSAGCELPKRTASEMSFFVSRFINEYAPSFHGTIRYVTAQTVDQCERLSGVLFNAYSNPLMNSASGKVSDRAFYGRIFGKDIVLSNYFDDRRDVALLLLRSEWPKALPIIQDGVATYYGGYMELAYADVKASLRHFLAGKRELDLSDDDNFYDLSIPVAGKNGINAAVVPLEGLIGAAIVEYSLNQYGSGKVRELLGCGNYADIFKTLGIPAADINDFIRGIL